MKIVRILVLLSLLSSPFAEAAKWYALLDWETPQCVDSSGPITSGPIAALYSYRDADDTGVVIAYKNSSGKIGGVYFRNRAACEKYASKYQKIWLKDRNG